MVLVGDCGTGKTNLLNRFTKDTFDVDSKETVGVDFGTRQISHDGKTIEAHVWDTAGIEHYKSMTAAYYRGAAGALLVYDITKRRSFESIDNWLKEVQKHTGPSNVTMLVGNKCDLKHLQAVNIDDAKDFAEDNNLAFIETSGLQGTNVDLAFETLLIEIYRVVRKNIEAGRCHPDRPCPSMKGAVLLTPAQQMSKGKGNSWL